MSINIGDTVQGEIIDFTHEGKGVLKYGNLIVFVNGGLIGDIVKVKISKIKKNFAIASLIKIIKPSKDRVNLDFNISESRGGIPLIEYRYTKQLEWKKNKVKEDLAKIAGLLNIKINDTIGMDDPFRYRNHTQIPVGENNGDIVLGFYEINSNNIVDMKGSILQAKLGDQIMDIIRSWMEEHKIKPYNRKSRKGTIRHIGIRVNKDEEAMLIIVTASNNLNYEKELIKDLRRANVVSIYQNINKGINSGTYGKKYRKIYGEDTLLDYIGDCKFHLSPNSFFQVNSSQAEVLCNQAIDYLDLNKEDIVYDLYSGIGTISLYIASKAKEVYGIEIVAEAVEDANKNAKINNISNTQFLSGKAEEIFPQLIKKGIKGNKVIVDPPRKGCGKEVLEAIVGLSPERIVYVSCNPSTMARDIRYLANDGYKILEVQPVDMFPHTAHVESVVLISKI